MKTFYPETRHLFDELRGKALRYTPEQIAEQFEGYIADLTEHPIVVTTTYQTAAQGVGDEGVSKRENRQTRTFPASPTISDFCQRWLGKSLRWWSELDKTKDEDKRERYIQVKALIAAYCRKVKLNGAEVGIYNANIVARELGLAEKQQVEQTGRSIQYVVGSESDIDELNKATDGTGLAGAHRP